MSNQSLTVTISGGIKTTHKVTGKRINPHDKRYKPENIVRVQEPPKDYWVPVYE